MCLYQFDFLFTPRATAALSKLNTHTQTHTLLPLSLLRDNRFNLNEAIKLCFTVL